MRALEVFRALEESNASLLDSLLLLQHVAVAETNQAQSLGSLGLAYNDLGRHDHAIDHFTQSLAISCEIGDRHGPFIRQMMPREAKANGQQWP